jgi:hypothetical protein
MAMATSMMKSMFKTRCRSIGQPRACQESGVKLIACQMTMDVMGVKQEDIIKESSSARQCRCAADARSSFIASHIVFRAAEGKRRTGSTAEPVFLL